MPPGDASCGGSGPQERRRCDRGRPKPSGGPRRRGARGRSAGHAMLGAEVGEKIAGTRPAVSLACPRQAQEPSQDCARQQQDPGRPLCDFARRTCFKMKDAATAGIEAVSVALRPRKRHEDTAASAVRARVTVWAPSTRLLMPRVISRVLLRNDRLDGPASGRSARARELDLLRSAPPRRGARAAGASSRARVRSRTTRCYALVRRRARGASVPNSTSKLRRCRAARHLLVRHQDERAGEKFWSHKICRDGAAAMRARG